MNSATLLTIFLAAGLIAALDPLVVAVFASLLAGSKGKGHAKYQQALIALTFIAFYGLLISAVGLALVGILSIVSYEVFVSLILAFAVVAIIWGLARVKNYFWYKPFGGIPKILQQVLHKRTTKIISPGSTVILVIATAGASIINVVVIIGGFAAIAALIKPGQLIWPVIVGLTVVSPLFLFYLQIHNGLRISALLKWKESNKKSLELSIGFLSIFLGWFMFLCLNGIFAS